MTDIAAVRDSLKLAAAHEAEHVQNMLATLDRQIRGWAKGDSADHAELRPEIEKPSDLVEILIRTSCPPDGIVGDLFAGSGSAGEAAMRAGRRYAGCEIDIEMAALANDRLASILPLTSTK